MSLLFESIACREGKLQNLEYHQARLTRSRRTLFKLNEPLNLSDIDIPTWARHGLWKCRVSYAHDIEKVEFTAYTPTNSNIFKLIEADIAYSHKFEDRSALNDLYQRKNQADDVIIAVGGLITDTSYGNLVFYDGQSWLTPQSPLLPGTMRASLLDRGTISEQKVRIDQLQDFQKFMMINALNPFDEARALPVKNII